MHLKKSKSSGLYKRVTEKGFLFMIYLLEIANWILSTFAPETIAMVVNFSPRSSGRQVYEESINE